MDHKILSSRLASFAHVGRGATEGPGTTRPSSSCTGEIDLDLLDVMLDLDPGALVWSPRQNASDNEVGTQG